MISIVVVYNNERIFNKTLLKSLKKQTAKFELIAIDNTKGKFKSASEALNFGGKQANGEYMMFVHQDVELASSSWLEEIEKILDGIPDLGVAGVAGMSERGKNEKERGRGLISSSGKMWELSNPIQKPEEVETLDGCLLIVPKSVLSKLQFDEKTFDGWHCYDVDYCLSVKQLGLKPYVVPMFIYHWSIGQDIRSLYKYQKRIYIKHAKNYKKKIYTTCGEISWYVMLRSPIEIFRSIYNKLFLSQIDYLKKELSDCNNVLDLGCGYDSPIRYFFTIPSVGVEWFEPHLQESKKMNIHDQYIKADIRKVEFKDKSFDAVLALNVIEYFTKEEGYELIQKMEKWARKKIIVSIPNGYLSQNQNRYNDKPIEFGWKISEFKKLGFRIYGMNGWKIIGYVGKPKFKPEIFWRLISNLTQKITYYYPNFAFQLLCVKEVK